MKRGSSGPRFAFQNVMLGYVTHPGTRRVMAPLLLTLLFVPALRAQQKQKTNGSEQTFAFESKTSLVLVPVIVRDRHAQIVRNLVRDDFQVFDNGKPQVISSFTIQLRDSNNTQPPIPTQKEMVSPHPKSPSAVAMPQRFIIFLFDDWHLDAGQLSQVRRAAAQVVGESLQETDAAAVISTSGQTNTGFTQDRTKLKDAIENLHLQSLYAHVYGCPDVSHYQANLIVNENDADALAEAIDDAAHCMGAASLRLGPLTPHLGAMETSVDAAAMVALAAARTELAMGEQGTRVTEGIIKQLIAKLGTMPGQHSLILISPGFFAGTLAARTEEERILDQAAQANVMISTLDARGLYTFMLDTSMRYISLDKEKYNKESLKTNDDVLAELAAGTGGTYFHNSNDLAGGFKKLAVAPECLYLLAFSPKNLKQDGSYHHLKVKVNLVGAKLQVRHGYFTEKAPKKKT